MKHRLFWVPFLLILDVLALHDILAGEPDVWMEWTVLGLSFAAYGLLIFTMLRGSLNADTN
ncbi:MAG: hypothetical protein E3J37_04475 [Anaerolineales bacterium]|nr:MAG: hypothetical protein E3J37_04475 [Anaerolineales bacterium]